MPGKKSRKWVAAFVFTLSALFVAQSLASDVIPAADSPTSPVVSDSSPASTPSATPVLTTSPSATAPAMTSAPDLSAGPNPSSSSTKAAAYALDDQNISMHIASTVLVDPRAKSAFMTPISLNSDSTILACISSPNLRFDAGVPNAVDSNEMDVLVGDFTNDLRIAGTATFVLQAINSRNGLKISSISGGVDNKSLQIRFVAISESSTDAELCNQAMPSNNRIINLKPFDIGLDMKKGDVRLAK